MPSVRSYPFLIARRYLAPTRRNRFIGFITAIAVLGVTFGVSALLISLAILDGFERTLRSSMIAFMGHIEVTSFGRRPLGDYHGTIERVRRELPELRAISPFASREAILRSDAGLEGVVLKGIMEREDVSLIRDRIVVGRFEFQSRDRSLLPSIVIGERLARRLGLHIGDTAVVFAPNGVPGPDNPPMIEQFQVGGVYRTGMAEYDDVYTYAALDVAQGLFDLSPDEVTGYDILVHDIDGAEEAARKLDVIMGYPHYPQTIFSVFQAIFAWLDLQRAPIPVVLGLIGLVAVFNIVGALLMVVLEKTESIGILATLGVRPFGISAIFVGQGLLIGFLGTALGSLIALGFTLIQSTYTPLSLDADIYYIDAVPVALVWWHYAVVVAGTLVLCVLFTLIPALIAARVRPVLALRFR